MFKAIRFRRQSPSTHTHTTNETTGRPWRSRLRRSLDVVILVGSAVALVYIVTVIVNVMSGYSVTAATPERSVRLQIVDGMGDRTLVKDVRERVSRASDLELTVEVVDEVRFDLRDMPRTFIIARTEDQASARLLARRLGLDPDEVTQRPLDHNSQFVTATLVLGQDARERMFTDQTAEEK